MNPNSFCHDPHSEKFLSVFRVVCSHLVELGQFSMNEYALLSTCLTKRSRHYFAGPDRTIRPRHGTIPLWAVIAQLNAGKRDEEWMLSAVVQTDSLEPLKKLCRMSVKWVGNYNVLVKLAGEHESTAILNWLERVPVHGDATYEAAREGRLESLIWAHQMDVKIASHACHVAAMKGHLHVLEWLKSMRDVYNGTHKVTSFIESDVVTLAATCGHVHVLEWCKEIGVPRCEFCCVLRAATARKKEGVIAWARKNGLDMTT